MFAKKMLITALLTTTLAAAGGATALAGGDIAASAAAAYDLVAGFDVDASGAHDLAIGAKSDARAQAQDALDEAMRYHPCDEYAATDLPQNPAEDLTSQLDMSASESKRITQDQAVETGLVDVHGWADGGAAATGAVEGLQDATSVTVDKPDVRDACDAYDQVTGALDAASQADADIDVPTRVGHEQGFEAAHEATAAADAAGDLGAELP